MTKHFATLGRNQKVNLFSQNSGITNFLKVHLDCQFKLENNKYLTVLVGSLPRNKWGYIVFQDGEVLHKNLTGKIVETEDILKLRMDGWDETLAESFIWINVNVGKVKVLN